MAGLGIKKWSTGDVLTASDLNGYVGEQIIAVFATVAARTAAYGGAGEPVLAEGMFSYVIDSDGSGTPAFQYYSGATWVDVVTAIGAGSITEAMLANGAVTAAKIADGTIVAAEIAADAVTTAKIADSAVTSAKIADGTIVNADINATAAIALSKLATSTAAHIVVHDASGVPTAVALSGDATITNAGVLELASSAVGSTELASSAVTTGKIASDAVTTAKIADDAVTSAKIASDAVTTAKIVDGAVTSAKLAAGVIFSVDDDQMVLAGTIFG
jgi:hypothetical protein